MLYPDDAKKLNGFMSGIIADGVHGAYVMNIKYLSYVSPEPYKSIFFNYIGDYKIFAYNVKDTAMFLSPSIPKQVVVLFFPLMSSFPFQGGIILSQLDPNNKHYLSTFFHECGHAVGEYSGVLPFLKWNASAPLQDALLKDVKKGLLDRISDYTKNIDQTNKIYESIMHSENNKEELAYDLKIIKEKVTVKFIKELEGTDAKDIFGGFSSNLVNTSSGGVHPESYWSNLSFLGGYKETLSGQGLQKMELFAHYFSANMRNDTAEIESLKKYFPESYKEMDRMIDAAGKLK